MIRFAEFEQNGPRLAGITEFDDGDFSLQNLQARRDWLESLTGIPANNVQVLSQVHGATVMAASADREGVSLLGEGDALITNQPGIALGIRVADCVPVYIFDPVRACGALVHAGREGTCLQIAPAAVAALSDRFSAKPASMKALIGPSAGPCCYEVDATTAKSCRQKGLAVSGRMVDLWESNRAQLIQAGLLPDNTEVTSVCTICGPAFHSYRRTGTKKRNLAVMML